MAMREITYVQALNEALREEMRRDPSIILLGEDIAEFGGAFKVTRGLVEEFGRDRVRNTPISESAIVGTALGAALTGTRAVAELMYLDFCGVAWDQIVNQAAKIRFMLGGQAKVPLVIRAQQGSGRGNAAQHSQSLEAWFVHTPGLLVVQPATPYDAKGLLKTALRQEDPVVFIEHKLLYNTKGPVPVEEYTIPFGVAEIRRRGTDVTVIATGNMLGRTLSAAERLAERGVSCEVIDPRTLFPLDLDTIVDSVKRTSRCVIVHEAVKRCGIGAEIAAQVMERAFDYLDAPVERVAALDIPIPYAPDLEKAAVPQEEDVIRGVERALEGALPALARAEVAAGGGVT